MLATPEGPYAGRVPKGYARSDERIREEICDELTRRPDIDPSRLTVSVTNGEVTLEGAVNDLESRRLADEIATRCAGVRQVHNVLWVERGREKKSQDVPARRARAAQVLLFTALLRRTARFYPFRMPRCLRRWPECPEG
jgi:hypothetical protein